MSAEIPHPHGVHLSREKCRYLDQLSIRKTVEIHRPQEKVATDHIIYFIALYKIVIQLIARFGAKAKFILVGCSKGAKKIQGEIRFAAIGIPTDFDGICSGDILVFEANGCPS